MNLGDVLEQTETWRQGKVGFAYGNIPNFGNLLLSMIWKRKVQMQIYYDIRVHPNGQAEQRD